MNVTLGGQALASYNQNSKPPANNVASSDNKEINSNTEAKKTGIEIKDGMEIDLSQYELKKFPESLLKPLPAPMTPAEYEAQLQRQGNEKQTAVIKENNKIIGTISNQGITSFSGSVGQTLANSGLHGGSDLNAIQSILGRHYGGAVTLDRFPSGSEPTYADIHDTLYNESYASLVARQTNEYQRDYNQNQSGFLVNVTA